MKTTLPAWATDPRGLPPILLNRDGYPWRLNPDDGTYGGATPADMESGYGPTTPLWPDPKPIDPADIRVGMRVRHLRRIGGRTFTVESIVTGIDLRTIYLADGDWFLIADAPAPAPDPLDGWQYALDTDRKVWSRAGNDSPWHGHGGLVRTSDELIIQHGPLAQLDVTGKATGGEQA